MNRNLYQALLYAACLILVSACATDEVQLAPNTQPGDQLEAAYLVGKWCNNRELTSKANSAAGFSAVLNLGKIFWHFEKGGKWEDSGTGWMHAHFGEWQLQGRDTVILNPLRGNPTRYRARFTNSGVDLYLTDPAGHFLVLTRCD